MPTVEEVDGIKKPSSVDMGSEARYYRWNDQYLIVSVEK
jgi:hypothetical protein